MNILTLLKAAIDRVDRAFKIVSYPHHAVHDGEMYQASYKSPDASPVADDASIDFLIIIGASIDHIAFGIAAGGDAEFELFEFAENSDALTPVTVNNMNRNDGVKHPTTTVFLDPTLDSPGFRIHNSFLPGGTGGNSGGGTARSDTEWNYRPSTKYLSRITNRAGNAQPMSMVVQWYEKGA